MHCKMHASCLPRKNDDSCTKITMDAYIARHEEAKHDDSYTKKPLWPERPGACLAMAGAWLVHAWPCLAHGWPEPGQPKRPIRIFCDTSHTECSISACDSHLANAKYAHPTMLCPPGHPPSTALPPDPHRRTKRILQAEPSRKKVRGLPVGWPPRLAHCA